MTEIKCSISRHLRGVHNANNDVCGYGIVVAQFKSYTAAG